MNRLFLHACCGPCLSAPLEVLTDRFDGPISIYFYNPNIEDAQEYERRREALCDYVSRRYGAEIVVEAPPHDPMSFREQVLPLAATGERGERCTVCYALRLRRSFEEASRRGATHVATTLTVSPHKDRKRIDRIGLALEAHYGVAYLTGTWDEPRSREICRDYGIYRQNYCGCRASAAERDARRRSRERNTER